MNIVVIAFYVLMAILLMYLFYVLLKGDQL